MASLCFATFKATGEEDEEAAYLLASRYFSCLHNLVMLVIEIVLALGRLEYNNKKKGIQQKKIEKLFKVKIKRS